MTRLAATLALLALAAACAPHDDTVEMLTGGDVARGRVALRQYACGTCHVIPGVTGADQLVGPPLNGIASRHYLGGVLPNTPENMIRWIRHPQDVSPLSAMPDLGVTERDARDMLAYLYTLP
jgi:cytochrome c2